MIHVHLLTLNYLVTSLQGKQQLCIRMLYESLAGQCEYATQPKGSFWCHVFGTKGAILLVMLLKFCLILI